MTPDRRAPLRALAVLPARLGSTRLPRKVLLDETGLALFVHSARNVARCPAIERVVVATDAPEVLAVGADADVEVVLTAADHASGTDRVNEVVGAIGAGFDVVVNVQADEPEIDPEDLARLVQAFESKDVEAATLCVPIETSGELALTSAVKVVRDAAGDALYFSRAPIPSRAHARAEAPAGPPGLRHLGVYAYRPAALAAFCALPVGTLEATENLEQLRWLEAGRNMRVLDAGHAPRGIDTRADYDAFLARVHEQGADLSTPSESSR